ncbi:hypothetical protein Tco_1565993, partial [Tanacetum coccineum]
LPKVVSTTIVGSDSEVEDVVDDHAVFITTKRDDNYDTYDDDLYESHDISENLQAISEELDITVRGWKNK